MRSEVDEFPVRDINETGYLLIPSRFPPVPIYGRIANGNDEQFVKLESMTNPRLKEREKLISLSGHSLDETSPKLQNWNFSWTHVGEADWPRHADAGKTCDRALSGCPHAVTQSG